MLVVASLDAVRNAQAVETLKRPIERPKMKRPCDRRGRPISTTWAAVDALFKTTLKEFGPPRHPGQQRHQHLAGQLLYDDRGELGTRPFDNKLRGRGAPASANAVAADARSAKWGA